MHGRAGVSGRDAHGRVLLGRGRAADQKRNRELPADHLLGHRHHLVEGRRDESRQPDRVGAQLHRDIVDLIVVAAEHDSDDVLADVVHVALDRR